MTTPENSVQWLDRIKEEKGISSDYKLAPILGLSRVAISQQRAGKQQMNMRAAITAAELLGLQPLQVIAAVMYHGDKKTENQPYWLELWLRVRQENQGTSNFSQDGDLSQSRKAENSRSR